MLEVRIVQGGEDKSAIGTERSRVRASEAVGEEVRVWPAT